MAQTSNPRTCPAAADGVDLRFRRAEGNGCAVVSLGSDLDYKFFPETAFHCSFFGFSECAFAEAIVLLNGFFAQIPSFPVELTIARGIYATGLMRPDSEPGCLVGDRGLSVPNRVARFLEKNWMHSRGASL